MQRAPYPAASANRTLPALPATLPGLLLVAGLWGFLVLALGALLGADVAGGGAPVATWFDSRIGAILWSATSQAMLSALGSLAVAVPASIMLARRYRWFGMRVLRLLVGLAFVIPTTVAASGLLAIWGRQGVINQAINAVNALLPVAALPEVALPELPTFFGLKAVVLAHIFFNAPLMIRVFLPRILSVPDTHWRLARMMGMTAWQQGRWIEFPAMKPLILPMVGLVFLFCFSSFSLVLMLGGGLRVTTLEVEIYSALRIAFDLPMAVALTLLQVGMALGVLVVLLRLAPHQADKNQSSWNQPIMIMRAPCDDILSANSFSLKTLDIFMIAILVLLLILPLAALAWRGVSGDVLAVLTSAHFWRAMGNSVGIAVASGVLVVGLACVLAETRTQLTLRPIIALLEMGVMVYLVVPAIVMGTAWFILLRGVADVFAVAPFLVLVANVMLGLPVAYRLLIGKWLAMRGRDERARLAYGLRGWRGVRFLTIPLMGREIGLIFGLGMAMSMGDLGVIALFASADFTTLPWLLYQQAGRYRVDEAAVTALMLMLVVSALFALGNGLGRWLARPPSLYQGLYGAHHA